MSRATAAVGELLDRSGLLRLALEARRRGLLAYGGLTVLTYHRVIDPEAVGELDREMIDATPAEFDAQMGYLARAFRPVSIEEVLEARAGGRPLPPDSVLVTFDDGYLDNFENALPILRRHGIKANFFIATRYVTERRLFWWEVVHLLVRRSNAGKLHIDYPQAETFDLSTPAARGLAIRRLCQLVKETFGLNLERFLEGVAAGGGVPFSDADERALGDRTLMTWKQIKAMRDAGMGVGSHTHGHRGVASMSPAELATDLATSRAILKAEIGESMATLAYPFGHSVADLPEVRKTVAEAGFELGFKIGPGINRVGTQDSLDTRRLTVDRVLPRGLARTWMTFPFLAS